MNNKTHVYATLDCGSDIGETLFIYGKDKREVFKLLCEISALTNWHFRERCTYDEMQQYMFSCPLADAINVDDYYIEDVKRIIRNFKFKKQRRLINGK